MPLQYKFFVIPVKGIQEAEAELNRFLRSVRLIHVERKFMAQGEHSFWGISVEYATGGPDDAAGRKSKIDYRDVLSPEDFSLFAKLREWRKAVAAKEGVQLYAVFTNDHLAKIAEKRIKTKAGLKALDGVGDERVGKYGEDVIRIVTMNTGDKPAPEKGAS